jgi:hypothetical protein
MPGAAITTFSNGVRLIDKQTWPFSDWSFFYWRFEEDGFFAQRSYLYEDHSNNLKTPERLLSAEWVVKDICAPLMFAHRVSLALENPTALGVHFEWSGIENRNLVSLNSRRSFFRSVRRCSEDRFQKTVVVERESNLLEIAAATVADVVWLFGVEKFRDSFLADQVPELLAGRYPR